MREGGLGTSGRGPCNTCSWSWLGVKAGRLWVDRYKLGGLGWVAGSSWYWTGSSWYRILLCSQCWFSIGRQYIQGARLNSPLQGEHQRSTKLPDKETKETQVHSFIGSGEVENPDNDTVNNDKGDNVQIILTGLLREREEEEYDLLLNSLAEVSLWVHVLVLWNQEVQPKC